jgi:hypothetical protein
VTLEQFVVPVTAEVPTSDYCPSCGAVLSGRYCAQCGERATGRPDLRVRAFLEDALYELANADSRIWRSVRSLFLQPGYLSEEYLAGRRRPWLGPVQLFLICNVTFFVLLQFLPRHVFTTRLSDHLFAHPYGRWILGMEARPGVTFRALVEDQEAFRVYANTFNAVTAGPAKSLIILMIPGVALILQLVWQHQRLRREQLTLTNGRKLRVLHPGFQNHEAGPDFKGAILQFDDDPPVEGDIEIDLHAGGWIHHHHQGNPDYARVILHGVWETSSHSALSALPTLLLGPCLDAPLEDARQ